MNRSLALVSVLLVQLFACSRADSQPNRCDLCGMRVAADSGWRAGAVGAEGNALSFDTPKCMFRYGARNTTQRPWVIEYYSQERRPADELHYVLGSDVAGPMGRDLVPIEGADQAERFRRDHHGARVLAFREVTPAIVDELFRPR